VDLISDTVKRNRNLSTGVTDPSSKLRTFIDGDAGSDENGDGYDDS